MCGRRCGGRLHDAPAADPAPGPCPAAGPAAAAPAKEPTAADCASAIWIDLVSPSREEDRQIERLTGIQVPTREEMAEIEVSSRLYSERGAHYMTANIIYAVDSPEPQSTAITFILTEKHLITVRYAEPRAVHRSSLRCATCSALVMQPACNAPSTSTGIKRLNRNVMSESPRIE